MPQVTHQFPSPGQPSSPSCSRSGSACLSAYSSFSSSGGVYNRSVPILPLNHLGQADSTPAPIRVSRKFFLIFQATCKNFRPRSYPLRQVANSFKKLSPERQWPATCFLDDDLAGSMDLCPLSTCYRLFGTGCDHRKPSSPRPTSHRIAGQVPFRRRPPRQCRGENAKSQ